MRGLVKILPCRIVAPEGAFQVVQATEHVGLAQAILFLLEEGARLGVGRARLIVAACNQMSICLGKEKPGFRRLPAVIIFSRFGGT